MRTKSFCAATFCCCCILFLVIPQDGQTKDVDEVPASTFLLEIIELHLPDADERVSVEYSAEDVTRLAKRSSGTNRHRRFFRLSAADGIEAFVQVAESVPTVTGKTVHEGEATFDYADTNVGTKLRATVHEVDDRHVQVNLSLTTSTVSLKDDGTRRHLSTLNVDFAETNFAIGRPKFMRASKASRNSMVVLSVTKLTGKQQL